jgi:proteasome lid subunit RPN8/RPN11/LysM repeat protein
MSQIDEHLASGGTGSLGGLLIGRRAPDGLSVVAAVPDRASVTHHGEVEFSTDMWKEAYTRLGEEFPGAQLIGWYHSHPEGGAELTDYDRTMHAAMFSEPEMVSLVIGDPTTTKVWYGWVLDRISELGASGPRGNIIDLTGVPPRRRLVRAAVVAGILAAAAGGFGVGAAARNPPADPRSAARTRAAETRRLRASMHDLQSRLASERQESATLRTELSTAEARLRSTRQKIAATHKRRTTVYVRYRVRRGDTLWQLAISFYGTPEAWPRIAKPNGIRDPKLIATGHVLRIPVATAK